MAGLTKVKGSGLATGAATDSLVGIDDNATSTAITIDASENVDINSGDLEISTHGKGVEGSNGYYMISSQSSGTVLQLGAGVGWTGGITFAPGTSTKFEVKNSGDVEVKTGNLVIGTSGKGIDFSADGNAAGMTSEVLDDYETGTWTPTQGAAIDLTGTFSSAGTYVKIGNHVWLEGWVKGSTSIGVSGYGGFTQLPFSIINNKEVPGSWHNINDSGVCYCWATSIYAGYANMTVTASANKISFIVDYETT